MVGMTNQTGGPISHPQASGFEFNEIELSWITPTSYSFTFQSFDAVPVPEPSSLLLLGSGLLSGATLLRKRFLA
jgi:hypothetical protein